MIKNPKIAGINTLKNLFVLLIGMKLAPTFTENITKKIIQIIINNAINLFIFIYIHIYKNE